MEAYIYLDIRKES